MNERYRLIVEFDAATDTEAELWAADLVGDPRASTRHIRTALYHREEAPWALLAEPLRSVTQITARD